MRVFLICAVALALQSCTAAGVVFECARRSMGCS
jgi:hypothetical protein